MPFIKSFFLFFFSQVGCDESQNLLIWADKADALWHQSGLFPAEPKQQSDCSGSFFLICAWRESPVKAAALHLRVFLMCSRSRPQTHRRSDGLEQLILRPCLQRCNLATAPFSIHLHMFCSSCIRLCPLLAAHPVCPHQLLGFCTLKSNLCDQASYFDRQ